MQINSKYLVANTMNATPNESQKVLHDKMIEVMEFKEINLIY